MGVQGLASGSVPFTSQQMVSGAGLTFSIPTVSSDSVAALAAQASLIAAQLREIEARAALAALHSQLPAQSIGAAGTPAPAGQSDTSAAAGGYASVLGGATDKGRAGVKGFGKGVSVSPLAAGGSAAQPVGAPLSSTVSILPGQPAAAAAAAPGCMVRMCGCMCVCVCVCVCVHVCVCVCMACTHVCMMCLCLSIVCTHTSSPYNQAPAGGGAAEGCDASAGCDGRVGVKMSSKDSKEESAEKGVGSHEVRKKNDRDKKRRKRDRIGSLIKQLDACLGPPSNNNRIRSVNHVLRDAALAVTERLKAKSAGAAAAGAAAPGAAAAVVGALGAVAPFSPQSSAEGVKEGSRIGTHAHAHASVYLPPPPPPPAPALEEGDRLRSESECKLAASIIRQGLFSSREAAVAFISRDLTIIDASTTFCNLVH